MIKNKFDLLPLSEVNGIIHFAISRGMTATGEKVTTDYIKAVCDFWTQNKELYKDYQPLIHLNEPVLKLVKDRDKTAHLMLIDKGFKPIVRKTQNGQPFVFWSAKYTK